jgi:outer membrane lipoprotein-sorting protein
MTNPDQDLIDMIAKATPDTPVNDDHRAALRRQVLDAYDQRDTKNEPDHRPLFKFTGANAMKLAASFTLLAAVGIFAVTALSPSKAIAFEDVAREILKIENASFEITSTITDADGNTQDAGTFQCTTQFPALMRTEMPKGESFVMDFAKNKMLIINPQEKSALLLGDFTEFTTGQGVQNNLFGEIQEHLRNAKKGGDFGKIKYKKLGEKKINDVATIGFRVLNQEANADVIKGTVMSFHTLDIWADAKTGGPVRLIFKTKVDEQTTATSTFENFVFNQEIDPKLFSFEAPEGYKLIDGQDALAIGEAFDGQGQIGEDVNKLADGLENQIESIVEELKKNRLTKQDVINALRSHAQYTDGKLPDNLVSALIMDGILEGWEKQNPDKELFKDEVNFSDERLNEAYQTLVRSDTYLRTLESTGGTYTYRGAGVRVDGERVPVLWLQSKGATAYTVIYNDFSVRDTNAGPPAE